MERLATLVCEKRTELLHHLQDIEKVQVHVIKRVCAGGRYLIIPEAIGSINSEATLSILYKSRRAVDLRRRQTVCPRLNSNAREI